MEATDMRSLSRQARHERRVQVVRLRKAGLGYGLIAQQTGLSRTGVLNICARHQAGGAAALRDRIGGWAMAWLAEHKDAIEVSYLPSYSPELNPDEMANADLKQAVTKQAPARTKLQLVKATARHLRSVQKQPARVQSYFQHDAVRYAA